jgi:hypothetical protein
MLVPDSIVTRIRPSGARPCPHAHMRGRSKPDAMYAACPVHVTRIVIRSDVNVSHCANRKSYAINFRPLRPRAMERFRQPDHVTRCARADAQQECPFARPSLEACASGRLRRSSPVCRTADSGQAGSRLAWARSHAERGPILEHRLPLRLSKRTSHRRRRAGCSHCSRARATAGQALTSAKPCEAAVVRTTLRLDRGRSLERNAPRFRRHADPSDARPRLPCLLRNRGALTRPARCMADY